MKSARRFAPLDDTIQLSAVDTDNNIMDSLPGETSDDRVAIVQPAAPQRHVQRRDSLFDEDCDDSIERDRLDSSATSGDDATGSEGDNNDRVRPGVSKRNVLAIFVLTAVNLLNYMDRFSIAGVIIAIQKYYNINDKEAGLLQTAFIISYMLLSPIFGYLGDRYKRTLIMSCGILGWSAITLGSSYVSKEHFWLFVVLRALVGIGEASYSTIAPTIIADLFTKTTRTRALCLFYFAIPVGSGLGYIAGSKMADALGSWKWALRLTPGLGFACAILIYLLVKEPVRGLADHGTHLHTTSWSKDLLYLVKHKSFMLSSAGFTCVAFVTGALAFWAPKYMFMAIRVHPTNADAATIAMIFGGITVAAGLIGVSLGTFIASKLRKYTAKADPFVCAFGLIGSAPFLFLVLFLARYNAVVTWILIFVGETLLCMNWALVTDILLYVVIPTRRSSAEAVQILMSHLFGDAGSPFLVGVISDAVKASYGRDDYITRYMSMQSALYMTCFACALGGGFFLLTAVYVEQDRKQTEKITRGTAQEDGSYDNRAVTYDDNLHPHA